MGASDFTEQVESEPFRYVITVARPRPAHMGEVIRRARMAARWTGAELAEWLGVHPCTVYNWENGGPILRRRDREKVGLFLGRMG